MAVSGMDCCCADGIVGREVFERFVRQHDTPAERVVGCIALKNRDVMGGISQFEADRKIQSSRSTAKARYFHSQDLL